MPKPTGDQLENLGSGVIMGFAAATLINLAEIYLPGLVVMAYLLIGAFTFFIALKMGSPNKQRAGYTLTLIGYMAVYAIYYSLMRV